VWERYPHVMSSSFALVPASARILSGILTVVAAASFSGCSDSHEEDVAYRPGGARGDGGPSPWPELPCLPRTDPRLASLASDCGAEDLRVTSGPDQGVDADGETVCRYHLSFTTPRGETCVVGRPLFDEHGAARTAPLLTNEAWATLA
jgi:hypothetical protein